MRCRVVGLGLWREQRDKQRVSRCKKEKKAKSLGGEGKQASVSEQFTPELNSKSRDAHQAELGKHDTLRN